ncbi:twin-arginine translocase subunit TatC [Corynebacterium sp. CCM 9203]|uniref:twin-arginine translocase subunit TatC n=1 Tax=Corynebacterium sp. CCM 9203 TaxID=3057615 RepID=UPI003525EE05
MSIPTPKKRLIPRRKRSTKRSADGTMTLVEHIRELRRRLIISLLALGIGTIIGVIWFEHSVFGLPTLGFLLREPYCSLPETVRADISADGTCKLLSTGPFEMLGLRLKVGALAGLVFASPVWLTQLWLFITPGLHKNERRSTAIFVTVAVLLFLLGAVLAYWVITFALEFLLTFASESSTTALNGKLYFSFLIGLLLVFGVSFEVPLIIGMLNVIGVVSYEQLKDKRRIIIFGIFCFAAVITPGQDPMSMVSLALALTLLVELSIQFCRFNDRRRERDRPEWADLDDDEASPLPQPWNGSSGGSGQIRSSGPVAAPNPIRPSTGGELNRPRFDSRPGSDFDDVL